MAHFLIITRYYPPEIAVEGVCVSEIARRMILAGHQVTVLTTVPNYPTGKVPQEYRGKPVQSEVIDGVRVIRTWCYITANKGFFLRILAQLSFGFLAPLLGWRMIGKPDLILVSSPPLFNVIAGHILSWLKRRPLVVRIADLWPESAVQLGVLHNRLFIRLAEALEWFTYERASVVWVVTEGIRNTLLRRGLPPERMFLATNGVDIHMFQPMPHAEARAKLGWDERFTILYAGNHGLAYDLHTVLDVAEQLQKHSDIHFLFVGDGIKKPELMQQAEQRHLTNITFWDPVPHDQVPLLMAAANVCLVPLRDLPLLKGSLPVKMFEIMACSRPCILGAEGIARQLAEQGGAAICIEPEKPAALLAAILRLYENPQLAAELGAHGRKLAESQFDYDQLASALTERIKPLYQPPVIEPALSFPEASGSSQV